ncbi:unknown [Bifidobacterium bifidum CAG:234]|nr:unknown [Bifidobacterium bifidum CAG:234]
MKYRAMYPRLRRMWYRFMSEVEFSCRNPAMSQLLMSRVRRITTSGTTIELVTLLARYPYIVSSQ